MAQRKPFHPLSYSKGDLVRPNAFSVTFQESGLYLMCNKCTIVMPKSVAIPVPWMTGIMQLAGRQNGAFAFNVSFYAGVGGEYDSLKDLYTWRNKCLEHEKGIIGLPEQYKKEVSIIVHKTNFDEDSSPLYEFQCKGVWPTDIQDIPLDVGNDGIVELSANFAADVIFMSGFQS
jgi:hypothetical protein